MASHLRRGDVHLSYIWVPKAVSYGWLQAQVRDIGIMAADTMAVTVCAHGHHTYYWIDFLKNVDVRRKVAHNGLILKESKDSCHEQSPSWRQGTNHPIWRLQNEGSKEKKARAF